MCALKYFWDNCYSLVFCCHSFSGRQGTPRKPKGFIDFVAETIEYPSHRIAATHQDSIVKEASQIKGRLKLGARTALSTAWHGNEMQNFVLHVKWSIMISSDQEAVQGSGARRPFTRQSEVTGQRSQSILGGSRQE